jgi:hypothetical protein
MDGRTSQPIRRHTDADRFPSQYSAAAIAVVNNAPSGRVKLEPPSSKPGNQESARLGPAVAKPTNQHRERPGQQARHEGLLEPRERPDRDRDRERPDRPRDRHDGGAAQRRFEECEAKGAENTNRRQHP